MFGWSRYEWWDTYPVLTACLYRLLDGFPSFRVGDAQAKAAVEELHGVIVNWPQDETKSRRPRLLLCSRMCAVPSWCFSSSSVDAVSEWDFFQFLHLFLFLFKFTIAFGLFFLLIFWLEGQRGVWWTAATYDSPETRLFRVRHRRHHTGVHLQDIYGGPFGGNLQWRRR